MARNLAHGSDHARIVDATPHDLILPHRSTMEAESIVLGMKDHRLTGCEDGACHQGPSPDQATEMCHGPTS
jgi:hypothetical protein